MKYFIEIFLVGFLYRLHNVDRHGTRMGRQYEIGANCWFRLRQQVKRIISKFPQWNDWNDNCVIKWGKINFNSAFDQFCKWANLIIYYVFGRFVPECCREENVFYSPINTNWELQSDFPVSFPRVASQLRIPANRLCSKSGRALGRILQSNPNMFRISSQSETTAQTRTQNGIIVVWNQKKQKTKKNAITCENSTVCLAETWVTNHAMAHLEDIAEMKNVLKYHIHLGRLPLFAISDLQWQSHDVFRFHIQSIHAS